MLSSSAWPRIVTVFGHHQSGWFPPGLVGRTFDAMVTRITLVTVVFVSLLAIDPAWISPDWTDLPGWYAVTRGEDVLAAAVRLAAIGLTGVQLSALSLMLVGRTIGSGALQRTAQRALLPALRGAAPLVLVAGSALPATATELRLPIVPPAVARSFDVAGNERSAPTFVVVEKGDSMWTIAAAHADADVGRYWRRVVDVNRQRFQDVDLIHPGDTVLLPPVNPEG